MGLVGQAQLGQLLWYKARVGQVGGGAVSNTWTPGSLGAVVPLAEACCLLPPTPPPPLKPIHSLLPLPRLPEPLTPPFQVRAGL